MLNCKQIRLGLLHSYKLFYYFFQFNNNNCEKRSRYVSTKKIPHESENWFAFSKIGITVSPGNSSRFRVSHSQSNYDSRSCGTKGAKTKSRRRCCSIANIYCCYYVGVWSEKNDTLMSVEMYRKYLVMLYFCIIIQDVLCYSFLPGYRIGKIIYFTTDSIPTTANVPCCVLL